MLREALKDIGLLGDDGPTIETVTTDDGETQAKLILLSTGAYLLYYILDVEEYPYYLIEIDLDMYFHDYVNDQDYPVEIRQVIILSPELLTRKYLIELMGGEDE